MVGGRRFEHRQWSLVGAAEWRPRWPSRAAYRVLEVLKNAERHENDKKQLHLFLDGTSFLASGYVRHSKRLHIAFRTN
jgi:hypothetical protein